MDVFLHTLIVEPVGRLTGPSVDGRRVLDYVDGLFRDGTSTSPGGHGRGRTHGGILPVGSSWGRLGTGRLGVDVEGDSGTGRRSHMSNFGQPKIFFLHFSTFLPFL